MSKPSAGLHQHAGMELVLPTASDRSRTSAGHHQHPQGWPRAQFCGVWFLGFS